MKKELIQEVKRIKQIMNINEGWGSVFKPSFQTLMSSGSILSLYRVLDSLENINAIDSPLNTSLRRELSTNADNFEDALDMMAKRMERISNQSDFNKVFDEFMGALDSSSATKISDDIKTIENATTQAESDGIKLSTTANMDPEMAKLYKKRLDSVTWKGSSSFIPTTTNSTQLEMVDSYLNNLTNNKMFNQMFPNKEVRKTLIDEMKDAIRSGNKQINNQEDLNNYFLDMKDRFLKLSYEVEKGKALNTYNTTKAVDEFFTKVQRIVGSGGKTAEALIDAGGGVASKTLDAGGKVLGAASRNGWKIFLGALTVVLVWGGWDYLEDMTFLGGIMGRGEEKLKETANEFIEAADSSAKSSGARGIPEVKPEETKPVVTPTPYEYDPSK